MVKILISLCVLWLMVKGSQISRLNCDFQNGFCGWSQSRSDNFDWTRHRGSTKSSGTGPSFDHTFQNSSGWYIYIETSSPQKSGERARLVSSTTLRPSATYCLSFWYHMYGPTINTLNVLAGRERDATVIWSRSGNHGDRWIAGNVSIRRNSNYSIIFEGIVGSSFESDIALDDTILTVAPNITSPHPTTLNVSEKQTIQLVCTATGNPTPSISWKRNGVVVGRGSPFNITAKSEDHKQCYTCVASNRMTCENTGNVCLAVKFAPNITSPHPTTLNVSEKQTVSLVCTATGNPTPSINWTRNGVLVGRGSPFNITAKPEDHNQCYTCVAYNGMPDAKNASVCLAVKFAPIITSPHPITLNVSEKQTAQLVCTAIGNPTPSINWTRNGVVVGRGSTFNITAKPEDHNQCYTCVAYNGMPDAKTASVCLAVKYHQVTVPCGKTCSITTEQCLSVTPDGNPFPSVSCRQQEIVQVTRQDKTYKMCGKKEKTKSTCDVSNGIGSCSFKLEVHPKIHKKDWHGSIRIINRNWDELLRDENSEKSKTLKAEIEKMLDIAYECELYVTSKKVLSFENGSVVVYYQLTIIGDVLDPSLPLKEALNSSGGTLNRLTIEQSSIRGSYVPQKTDGGSKPLNSKVIIAISVCVPIVLIIIIVLVVCCYKKNKEKQGGNGNINALEYDNEGYVDRNNDGFINIMKGNAIWLPPLEKRIKTNKNEITPDRNDTPTLKI